MTKRQNLARVESARDRAWARWEATERDFQDLAQATRCANQPTARTVKRFDTLCAVRYELWAEAWKAQQLWLRLLAVA